MRYLYFILMLLAAPALLAQQDAEANSATQWQLPALLAPNKSAPVLSKTTTDCPDGVDPATDELFQDRSARDRVELQPGDSITFRSSPDSQYFRVSSSTGDTTYSTVTQVAQSFTIDASGYDTLAVTYFSSDMVFNPEGTEDFIPAYVFTGEWVEIDEDDNGTIDTANTIDTALVYPTTELQSTQYLPSSIFSPGADIGRPQYGFSGFREVQFDSPRNLLSDANFFNNNTVFVSLGINGPDFDDEVIYSTGFEGLGQGQARLFFQLTDEPTSTASNVRWRNTIYNFTPTAQLDRDLNIIPTLYGAQCSTVTRAETYLRVDGLTLYGVYPNPVQHTAELAFELSDASELVRVTVVDITGRAHFTTELGQHLPAQRYTHSLDFSDLSAGKYFLRVQTSAGSMAVPIVK